MCLSQVWLSIWLDLKQPGPQAGETSGFYWCIQLQMYYVSFDTLSFLACSLVLFQVFCVCSCFIIFTQLPFVSYYVLRIVWHVTKSIVSGDMSDFGILEKFDVADCFTIGAAVCQLYKSICIKFLVVTERMAYPMQRTFHAWSTLVLIYCCFTVSFSFSLTFTTCLLFPDSDQF
jgi:hypothetical protein